MKSIEQYRGELVMEFMTAKQAANAWSISPRRVAILCEQGRIDGVKKPDQFG
jgi:hypothetical protein